jgi:hypothetical protein
MQCILIILGFTGIGFYIVSARYANTVVYMEKREKQMQRKKEFNEIILLVREQEFKEAEDALYNYDNKYNQS